MIAIVHLLKGYNAAYFAIVDFYFFFDRFTDKKSKVKVFLVFGI